MSCYIDSGHLNNTLKTNEVVAIEGAQLDDFFKDEGAVAIQHSAIFLKDLEYS